MQSDPWFFDFVQLTWFFGCLCHKVQNSVLGAFDMASLIGLEENIKQKKLSTGNFPLGLAKDGAMMQEMRAPNQCSSGPLTPIWGPHFLHHGPVLGQPKRKIATLHTSTEESESFPMMSSQPVWLCFFGAVLPPKDTPIPDLFKFLESIGYQET